MPTFTNRNHVICNHSMCNYVRLNVAYNYEWSPMWLFFKFGWILVFFSTNCNYDLFHHSNKLIFHDVFVFFTTLYICFVTRAIKVVTYTPTYVCTYHVHTYLHNYYLPTYLPTYLLCTYILRTYLLCTKPT